jgi:hypothetical protein
MPVAAIGVHFATNRMRYSPILTLYGANRRPFSPHARHSAVAGIGDAAEKRVAPQDRGHGCQLRKTKAPPEASGRALNELN